MSDWNRRITQISNRIIHVLYEKNNEIGKSAFIQEIISGTEEQNEGYVCDGEKICFGKDGRVREIACQFEQVATYRYGADGEPVYEQAESANGTVTIIKNAVKKFDRYMDKISVTFESSEEEMLFGLGQHEDGIYNYKGKQQYLYQHNMKISIPFILSTDNYGILIDTESSVRFNSHKTRTTFVIDAENKLSYYVILGDTFDEIIYNLRLLTGRASMLPRWAFGYIQSKEKYCSSKELVETAQRFRDENIPLDCLVQDWCTWEDKKWGQKTVDKVRYPDLPGMVKELHDKHVHLMVSVWPNMDAHTDNYKAFAERDMLLPNSNVYDAYNEKARDLYWEQCDEEWFSSGIDAWWCDSCEPFTASDWCGEIKKSEKDRYETIMEEAHNSAPWGQVNSYGLWHGKGIYEHWREQCSAKRVVNLSRSTYISGQKYGIIPWSGDISAKWSTMKKQIAEGLNMCMSGMPYWTLDIGGFFTVCDKWENRGCNLAGDSTPLWFWNGDYNDGVKDLGYCELYTRWLQYGTFLPIFRSHGTDTPREPWNFGSRGDIFYDTIIKFIQLRYRLLPYIYSLAAAVSMEHKTIMKSLMFDFKQDRKVWEIKDSYMFGDAFLVSPVTEPMYYMANSKKIDFSNKEKQVYLPEGSQWYDYWTKEVYSGGITVKCKAEIETMPLFVRAGSIIPMSDVIRYTGEEKGETGIIEIYDGADGKFSLYYDSGDGYEYEEGEYCVVEMRYQCSEKSLYFMQSQGNMGMTEKWILRLYSENEVVERTVDYKGEPVKISFTG